ncbi:MAG: PTS sugar transporter subunit IIC [Elusimicrobia bacterium]|nr:PTS sugar transporter subunit IIC [Elusimicrobiota bacterium]
MSPSIEYLLVWLPLASSLSGFLQLDSTRIGQWMLSRPIVIGPVLGVLFGAPELGMWLGALWELLTLENLPVGESLPPNACVATAVCVLCAVSPAQIEEVACVAWGMLAGILFRRVEVWIRTLQNALNLRAERLLQGGKLPPLAKWIFEWCLFELCLTMVFIYFASLLGMLALPPAWSLLPFGWQQGFHLIYSLLPFLGLALAFHLFRWAGG